jgi:manganese oxidase
LEELLLADKPSPVSLRLWDQSFESRFGNLSAMEHHPIHLHGFDCKVIETDDGQIPE